MDVEMLREISELNLCSKLILVVHAENKKYHRIFCSVSDVLNMFYDNQICFLIFKITKKEKKERNVI